MTARDELALLLINTQRSRYSLPPRETTEHCSETCWAEADAILAAGYRKAEPLWADSLRNDGTYEYTVSSDCDGSNVQYWRRVPGKTYIEAASPWQAYEPEPQP